MYRFTGRADEDLDREILAHLDLEAEEQQDSGLAPGEAAYAARRAFGNVTLIKEDTRAVWGWTSLETLWQDVRYALRMMRKMPGFTAVAVISLALGVGLNSSVFSVLNALFFRPLPVPEPDRLVRIFQGRFGIHRIPQPSRASQRCFSSSHSLRAICLPGGRHGSNHSAHCGTNDAGRPDADDEPWATKRAHGCIAEILRLAGATM